jgi:hypothetical protein
MQTPPEKEWRHLALNPATDTPLIRSRRTEERGTDLLAHTAPSGTLYYYLWHWSENPNETNICQLTTEDSAHAFVREQGAAPEEHERLREYLPGYRSGE